jgi:hypothetical protein
LQKFDVLRDRGEKEGLPFDEEEWMVMRRATVIEGTPAQYWCFRRRGRGLDTGWWPGIRGVIREVSACDARRGRVFGAGDQSSSCTVCVFIHNVTQYCTG